MSKDPFGSGGMQSNEAHRSRLEMMQQERLKDPNRRPKRFHWRAVMTPMLMKYWVPMAVLFGFTIAMSNQLSLESREKKAKIMEQRFGNPSRGADGLPNDVRERYMREHLDRVIKGEDTFKVAEELQERYKQEQQKLKRVVPTGAAQMTSQSQSSTSQTSPLRR